MQNKPTRYAPALRAIHWLMFLMLVGVSILGFYFSDMPRGDEKSELIRLHASFGVSVLMLLFVRLLVRGASSSPDPVEADSWWQQLVAKAVHALLYAVPAVVVLAGMWTLFTVGWNVPFFGLFEIPTWYERDMDLHHLFEEIHVFAWWAMAGMVGLHLVGVIYHRLKGHRDILYRISLASDRSEA